MHLAEHKQQHSLLADDLSSAAVGASRPQVKVTDVSRDIYLVEGRNLAGVRVKCHPTRGDHILIHLVECRHIELVQGIVGLQDNHPHTGDPSTPPQPLCHHTPGWDQATGIN